MNKDNWPENWLQQPKVVGWLVLYPQESTANYFAMYYKPTDEQIKNTEQLLGCGWKDAT